MGHRGGGGCTTGSPPPPTDAGPLLSTICCTTHPHTDSVGGCTHPCAQCHKALTDMYAASYTHTETFIGTMYHHCMSVLSMHLRAHKMRLTCSARNTIMRSSNNGDPFCALSSSPYCHSRPDASWRTLHTRYTGTTQACVADACTARWRIIITANIACSSTSLAIGIPQELPCDVSTLEQRRCHGSCSIANRK